MAIEQGGADTTPSEQLLEQIAQASGSFNFIQKDEGATYIYFGYTDGTNWLFKRKTVATGVWQRAAGTGDYDTNWADRAAKTYTYA